jgi:thiamine biosynthesis lipoprotein
MGTRIELTLWHPDGELARRAKLAVMDEMRRIDDRYSPYRDASELSQVNRLAPRASAQQPLPISPEMTLLLDKSLYYGHLTQGAFDITFGSLGRYYNYREAKQPSAAQREQALPAIDYRLVHLDTSTRTVYFSHPRVYIDLGGIAKGYAVDRAIAILRELGIEHASVSAGGDSRVLGDRRGRPWLVGIKNPRDPASVAITLPLEDAAISTSGDYERYFVDGDGQRIHHILNPRTGQSASGIASVSVIGPAGFDTDALSTAVFVLGVEPGLTLLNRLDGFDGIIITAAGKVHYSEGLTPP